MNDLEARALAQTWFYPFKLPSGQTTKTYDDGALDGIHHTRLGMIDAFLQREYGNGLAEKSVVDLACHQGYFSMAMAERGAKDVLAVDARDGHVADATLIRDALGHKNVRFMVSDVHDVDAAKIGQFDLVLMLGLIYHLENPIGAIRLAQACTRKACLIETQIVPGMTGMVDFGSYRFVRPLKGSFGVIDETDETHGPETGTRGICLVPSLEALVWIMYKVGFKRVEVLQPPDDAYEQLRHGKRALVAGFMD